MSNQKAKLIVEKDLSNGQGHCWREDTEIPPHIMEEIEAEIIDGNSKMDDFTASNGLHYRW
jgi:hypothetical protein